jgi:hypothetical protein
MAEGTIKGFFLTCLLGGCNPDLFKVRLLLGGKGKRLFSMGWDGGIVVEQDLTGLTGL